MTPTFPRRRVLRAGLAAAALPLAGGAFAQPAGYPARPLRMIIGFAPGGPTDIVARVIAARLAEQLGVGVVVDNKPGAGGNLAADLAAKATPDGYTLFYNTSAITIAPSLYGKVPYDTLKDFLPVTTTASLTTILRFSVRKSIAQYPVRQPLQQRHAHDEADEEHDRDRAQDQPQADVALALLFGGHHAAGE